MFTPSLIILLVTTVLSFCSLYLPQPILPLLARAFAVTPVNATLLVSVTMFPLAVAPIFYGYFLQSISARRLLIVTLAFMAGCQVIFALAPTFEVALLSRLLLGFALPAAFTALMTVISSIAPPEKIRQAMGIYIATTIFGGFSGRALGGFLTTAWGWQTPFLVMAVLLALNVALLFRLTTDSGMVLARPGIKVIKNIFSTPHFLLSYLIIFCVFFVFAGLLNNLPFRLEELDPNIQESDISLIYTGYMIGIVTALGANRLALALGGESRALLLGLAIFFVATTLFTVESVHLIFLNVFLFSIGMFTLHSILSAGVNQRAGHHKGVVNGLYLAVYYTGGSLGSWLPAFLYARAGWTLLLLSLILVLAAAFILVIFLHRTLTRPRHPFF